MIYKKRQKGLINDSGQTILEISIIFALVAAMLIVMTPYMKRTIQGMIKVTSDQLGNQAEAEQDFTSSYTSQLRMLSNKDNVKTIQEESGITSYIYGDTTETESSLQMPLGSQERED